MKDDPGYSLLEVLITVAALIILTTVISNWLQSRRSAQESAAAQLQATNTQSLGNTPFNQALIVPGSVSIYNFRTTVSGFNNTANV